MESAGTNNIKNHTHTHVTSGFKQAGKPGQCTARGQRATTNGSRSGRLSVRRVVLHCTGGEVHQVSIFNGKYRHKIPFEIKKYRSNSARIARSAILICVKIETLESSLRCLSEHGRIYLVRCRVQRLFLGVHFPASANGTSFSQPKKSFLESSHHCIIHGFYIKLNVVISEINSLIMSKSRHTVLPLWFRLTGNDWFIKVTDNSAVLPTAGL